MQNMELIRGGPSTFTRSALSKQCALQLREIAGEVFELQGQASPGSDVMTEPMSPVVGLQHTGREGPAVIDAEDSEVDVERHGPRILAVDDDPSVGRLMKDLLAGAGYRVTAVHDGAQALTLLKAPESAFDLVILDVKMHPMDGTEIFARAAKLRPDVPILFCSGHTSDDRVALPGVLDDATVMMKPFRAASLFEMVWSALAEADPP